MQQLELATSAPIGKPSWTADLQQSLRQLEAALKHHIAEVQAPDGLFDGIVEEAPRLQRAVSSMRDEHLEMVNSVTNTLELTTQAVDDTDRSELRDVAINVLVELVRHRQRGADLIYEAYDVDIGGY